MALAACSEFQSELRDTTVFELLVDVDKVAGEEALKTEKVVARRARKLSGTFSFKGRLARHRNEG
jgi:hypothetical protein